MSELLILTIIVSIVLGISLQSAFIGIIFFTVGLIIALIVAGTLGFGLSLVIDNAKQRNTPTAIAARQAAREKRSKDGIVSIAAFFLIVLAVVLPVAIGVLLANLSNNTALIAILPPLLFFAELYYLFPLYVKKILNKKHTKKS